MAIFKEQLRGILNYYENVLESYSSILKQSPSGSLIWQNNKGNDQFLHYYAKDGKKQRKVITKDEAFLRSLARKEFARRSLEVLEPNVKALRCAIGQMKPFDPQQILRSMRKGYAKLPEDFFFGWNDMTTSFTLDEEIEARIERHRDWGNAEYKQSEYKPWQKKHCTSKGLKVRSKSEALIIESLYHFHDLPHRYEMEQQIEEFLIAPDVTFEDANRELFYLEHLGMMDDPDYAKRNFQKLIRYYDAGLIPGENLILSFDRQGTIDMRIIQSIIINEIIPRL